VLCQICIMLTRFYVLQLQLKDDAVIKFKSELAALELELQVSSCCIFLLSIF
jgi:hypothetical protein